MPITYDALNDVYSVPVDGVKRFYVLKNVVDFSDNNVANAETMAIFDLPANTLVMEVLALVTTADTLVSDVDIGIVGADVDGFQDGVDISSAGWKRQANVGAGIVYVIPTCYISTSDVQIGIINNDAQTIDDAVVEFYALCVDLN